MIICASTFSIWGAMDRMDNNVKRISSFGKHIIVEMKLIEVSKWFEGERRGCDPGDLYVLEWINKHAESFRQKWESSLCKDCVNWRDCGFECKVDGCKKFIVEVINIS